MFPGYVRSATQRDFFSNLDTAIPTEARRERQLLSGWPGAFAINAVYCFNEDNKLAR
jgi:hypothetical protein